MDERSDTVKEQAVRNGSAAYLVEPQIASSEGVPPRYKRTEVGVIPEDWSVYELREVLSEPPSYGINAAATQYEESLPAYLRITDIDSEGRFSPDPPVSVNHKSAHDYFLSPGDLVFARTGASVGKSYEYNPSDGRLVYAGFLIRVSPDTKRLDPTFLSNFCRTEHYWNWVRSVCLRSGQPGVNGAEYGSLLVPVPPIKEQCAIATALSDADALIESLDRLIAKKRAIKQATMQQLLTGQTRLPGFTGEWETKRLGEIGTFYKGRGIRREDVRDEGVPCIRYGEIYTRYGDCVAKPESKIPEFVSNTAFPLQSGDILFAGSGETAEEIGMCVTYLGEQPAFAGGDIVVLRPNRSIPVYLGRLLNHPTIAQQKARLGQGDAVVHISARNLAQIEVHFPDQDEQLAIATILTDMDTEIEALEHRRDKARQVKQGMMQQLLTGRVRLVEPGVAV